MQFSDRVTEITQKHYAPLEVDRVLNTPSVLVRYFKDVPEPRLTRRLRLKLALHYYFAKVKVYFSNLWDAVRGRKAECDHDDDW